MKIPLRIIRRFGQPMPFILITIKAPRVSPMPIEALVDTGSPWIAITPRDILRLNLSIKRLRRAKEYPMVSLAGYKFQRYELQGSVRVKDEERRVLDVNLPISVLWPTKKKMPEEVKHIPSVLGIDFLIAGKFHLYFDPNKRIAFLEKEI